MTYFATRELQVRTDDGSSYAVSVTTGGIVANRTFVHFADDLGCIGNGTFDNTLKIDEALSEIHALGGGVLHFGKGHYHVATGVTHSYDNITIEGEGPGVTSIGYLDGDGTYGGSNNYDIFTITGDGNAFREITLSNGPAIDIGATEPGGGSIMWLEGVTGFRMNNVTFKECGGIRGLGGREINDMIVDSCLFENISRTGAYIQDTCNDIKFLNSTFRNVLCDAPGSNRYLLGSGYSGTFTANPDHLYFIKGFTVDNCTCEGNPSWEGIDNHGGEDVHITNNTVRNCRIGISVQSPSASGAQVVSDNVLKRCIVSGNTIDRGTAGTSLYGINVSGSSYGSASNGFLIDDVHVHDNVILGMGGTASEYGGAIHVKRCYSAKVHDNTIEEFAQAGIIVDDSCADIEFYNNTIKDAGTTHYSATTVACISLYPGKNIQFRNNTVINTTDNIDYWYYSKATVESSVSVRGTRFLNKGSVQPALQPTGTGISWHMEAFNVLDFGAGYHRTDSDNALAIQHAVDLAEDIGAGIVYFPTPTVGHTGVTVSDNEVLLDGPGVPNDIEGGASRILRGTANPENAITAPTGSIYMKRGGGANSTFWVKETSPTGDTGWVAMT